MQSSTGAVKYRGRVLVPGGKKPNRTPKPGSVYCSFPEERRLFESDSEEEPISDDAGEEPAAQADSLIDRDVVKQTLESNPMSLETMPSVIKADREMVSLAVKGDAAALQFAKPKFRNDFELAFSAVSRKGFVLQYLSQELRANEELVVRVPRSQQRFSSSCLEALRPSTGQVASWSTRRCRLEKHRSGTLLHDKWLQADCCQQPCRRHY
eukprot:TRINITY_DN9766_c0_g1_i2.p2 TRINITY_DN9766_c0_g1~~TRINITY_DN9766_c0_g1_i2.p2  ORF type:complete len:210 (-),score=37.93 TRINITY_DN9766_c0_g1_i2:167-796(-)